MATTRLASQNNRLPGIENTNALLGKAMPGKAGTVTTRSALSNIGNKVAPANVKKGLTEQTNKPLRVPVKGKSVIAKKDEKENAKVRQVKAESKKDVEERPASPAPMDISGNGAALALENVQNIDRDDADNPQLVSEYVNEIYDYMRQLELKFSINKRYLNGDDHDVNGRMRGILIDWLVQVHLRFHLLQETLYLTVAIIDRFLQKNNVNRSRLQLVGVTSMLLAAKYEEMYAPEIRDFEYIADNAYSTADIRKMECIILQTLDFSLGRPLPLHFLRRNSKAGEVDAAKHTLAKYLMELSIVDYDMVHYHPSEIAASALCLSMKVLGDSEWDETLQFYSKYPESHLEPIMQRMAMLVVKASQGKLTAIYTKYKSSKFLKIALLPELKQQTILDYAKVSLTS